MAKRESKTRSYTELDKDSVTISGRQMLAASDEAPIRLSVGGGATVLLTQVDNRSVQTDSLAAGESFVLTQPHFVQGERGESASAVVIRLGVK